MDWDVNIRIIVMGYLILSFIVVVYAVASKRDLDNNPIFGVSIFNNYFFGLGAFIISFGILYEVIQLLLPFLPEDATYIWYEDNIRYIKEDIASGISLATIFTLVHFVTRRSSKN
jgi:hypothetical protein